MQLEILSETGCKVFVRLMLTIVLIQTWKSLHACVNFGPKSREYCVQAKRSNVRNIKAVAPTVCQNLPKSSNCEELSTGNAIFLEMHSNYHKDLNYECYYKPFKLV